jgi:hypothetical protein
MDRRYGHRHADPHWITTKYATKLPNGSTMPAGSRAFYYPAGKAMLFGQEAEEAAAKFAAECDDERNYAAGVGV